MNGRPRHVVLWTVTGVVWALGLTWLVYSAYTALYHGPADILRRWRVSQYVCAGRNPYQVALKVLEREVGPINKVRLAKRRVFHIPQPRSDEQHLGVLTEYGPPEAVYPPAAQAAFVAGLSWLPRDAVLAVWLAVNLGLVVLWNVTITRIAVVEGLVTASLVPLVLGLCLLWAPTQQTIISSQFSLLVALLILLSVRWLDGQPWLSAWALSLALIKPSMALPFVLLPLIQGSWRVLVGTAAAHAVASTVVGMMVGSTPWLLTRQWFAVAQYFTQGPYSLQTVLNKFGAENTGTGFAVFFVLGAGTVAWLVLHRRARKRHIVDFLCLISVLWTYHGPYDLVLLLVPLLGLGRCLLNESVSLTGKPVTLVIVGLAFVVLSLATWSPTYVGDQLPCQAVRWLGRGVLVALLAITAWRVRQSAIGRRTSEVESGFPSLAHRAGIDAGHV